MNKREKGSVYEEKAVKKLEENNYVILCRNYFYGKNGEIDIIARKNNLIVFVEVKYRSSDKYGSGHDSVNKTKMKRMYKTAQKYILQKKYFDLDIRFDLIAFIFKNNIEEIEWLENILWGDEIGC